MKGLLSNDQGPTSRISTLVSKSLNSTTYTPNFNKKNIISPYLPHLISKELFIT
ncbi:hypothetical protein LguiA_014356 [Lonicera macranthoides]